MWSRCIQEAFAASVWVTGQAVLVFAGWLALLGWSAGYPEQDTSRAVEEASQGKTLASLPIEILTKPLSPKEAESRRQAETAEPATDFKDLPNQSLVVSNAIELQPAAVANLNSSQVEQLARSYQSDMDRNGAVLTLQTSGRLSARELGNTFLLLDEQGRPCGAVDEFGSDTTPSGLLSTSVKLSDLPFSAMQTKQNQFRKTGRTVKEFNVILNPSITLELFRSLYTHLSQKGLERPQPNWQYDAKINSREPLNITWTSRSSNHINGARTP